MAVREISCKEMTRIDHIALYVSDLEQAKDFFIRYFGGKTGEPYHNPKSGLRSYFIMFAGDCLLEIMSRDGTSAAEYSPFRRGMSHFALSVGGRNAVEELTSRLSFDGYTVVSGPRVTGDGYYESCIKICDEILLEITA